jgi:hypothetical protein
MFPGQGSNSEKIFVYQNIKGGVRIQGALGETNAT